MNDIEKGFWIKYTISDIPDQVPLSQLRKIVLKSILSLPLCDKFKGKNIRLNIRIRLIDEKKTFVPPLSCGYIVPNTLTEKFNELVFIIHAEYSSTSSRKRKDIFILKPIVRSNNIRKEILVYIKHKEGMLLMYPLILFNILRNEVIKNIRDYIASEH